MLGIFPVPLHKNYLHSQGPGRGNQSLSVLVEEMSNVFTPFHCSNEAAGCFLGIHNDSVEVEGLASFQGMLNGLPKFPALE
jgi:hypothetical protein